MPSSSLAEGVVLDDFPALLRLSSAIDGFDYADFKQENGGDLAFLDARGNLLAHEIDTWNPDGESLVWVKVPKFAAGTVVHAVYGNADWTAPAQQTENTWSGYTGVWHMREASGEVADATGHGLTATPGGARAEYNVGISDGVVGMARQNGGNGVFAAANRAYLSIPDYDSFALGDTFTASGFFRTYGTSGWYRFFSRKGPKTEGWGQEWVSGTSNSLNVYGSYATTVRATLPDIVRQWVYLTFVYSGATCTVYANGERVASGRIDNAQDNGQPLSIGCTSDGNEWCLYGDYDEVRLSAGNLSAERIAADYATATDAAFLSYSAVSGDALSWTDLSDYSKFVQIRASATALPDGGELEDFPALVRLSPSIEGFSYSDFQLADGGDLLFTDESGRVLDHEVDLWDASGESLVWVRIPAFANGTAIFAHYGCGEASGRSSSGTWRGFKGVWHMNTATTETEPDSSGNGLDAVPKCNSTVSRNDETPVDTIKQMTSYSDGAVGKARRNMGGDDSAKRNWLSVPDPGLGATFTASGWFHVTVVDGWHQIFSNKIASSDDGWDVLINNNSKSSLNVSGSGGSLAVYPVIGGKETYVNKWMHLAFVYDGASLSVYRDGKLTESGSGKIKPAADNGNAFAIGNRSTGKDRSFEGYYDEVRLATSALSAERIAADCATVTDSGFFSYGGAQSAAAALPSVSAPSLSVSASGEPTATVVVNFAAAGAKVRLTSASGEAADFVLNGGAAVAAGTYSLAIPHSSLPAVGTYAVTAVGVNENGGEVESAIGGCFYNGALSVERASDADEDGLVAGAFTVSRADAHGDLVVNYSLGGTAVAGTDYEGAASGAVTIRDGETSATVAVAPKVNAAVNADTSVSFAFASGNYPAQSATAALTIKNLAPASTRAFRRRLDFTVAADFLADGETLENFPVLVRLSEGIDGFRYDEFKSEKGGDMLFTSSGGAAIPSEIDTWNEDGESLVWVVVPTLTKGTRIKMFYGNGINPAGHFRAKWPGYAGVWHMGEDGGTAYDSTDNALDAEPVQNRPDRTDWAADLTAVSDGAVGRGRTSQAGTTYYSVSDYYHNDEDKANARRNYLKAPSYDELALGARFTLSGWFRTTGGTEWYEAMVSRHESGVSGGWRIERMPTADGADKRVNVANVGNVTDLPDMRGAWVHLAFSYDGTDFKCFANGETAAEKTLSSAPSDNGLPLTFGHYDNTRDGMAYYGQFDEVRLKCGAATASWAKAEYLSVADAAFAKPGSVQPACGGLSIVIR